MPPITILASAIQKALYNLEYRFLTETEAQIIIWTYLGKMKEPRKWET